MKLKPILLSVFSVIIFGLQPEIAADNQTPTVSPIFPDKTLPFRVFLKKADFELPVGIQSYIHAIVDNKWLIITGRSGGLHGFVQNSEDNFPVQEQSTIVFVIDPINKVTYTRSLLDPQSGLTQAQVDLLSVTAAQGYQKRNTLYITGGYGVVTATGKLDTKNSLTAIDIPGLMHWVVNPSPGETAAQHIRQIFDDIFKVTGGYMNQVADGPTLLMVGHEFNGFYADPIQQPPVFQHYTDEIRRFIINDDGVNLSIVKFDPLPLVPDPNLRRRDLNVSPIVKNDCDQLEFSFDILSGVFTPTTGVWTVPVQVTKSGEPSMADPSLPSTFKQGMNNYDCATLGMFSERGGDMYTILFGGMSYGFFEKVNNKFVFQTNDDIPFISQTTAIKIDKHGVYRQFFMPSATFPTIPSTTVHPGNTLLLGSEAEVFLLDSTHRYRNGVVKLDSIKRPTVIGYIVGGIQSTLPDTEDQTDSAPSKFIFQVIVSPLQISL